jgi:probable O-glycosylation ligase (exosortase A-associated)
MGPSTPLATGSYSDENLFAMLFVIAIPFFYFLAQQNTNKFIKVALYMSIPLAWHCIFLTGSRGGLIGLLIISLHILIRSRKIFLGVLFGVALAIAFVYQGGEVMKSRTLTIIEYQDESSATGRLEAWELASKMFMDHPIFGVGLGNFTIAWEKYKNSIPRVAHSSIIQFAAESGIFTVSLYVLIFIMAMKDLGKIRRTVNNMYTTFSGMAGHIISMVNALEGACIGFFICGLFLSLGMYEIYYIMLMIIVLLKRFINHGEMYNTL